MKNMRWMMGALFCLSMIGAWAMGQAPAGQGGQAQPAGKEGVQLPPPVPPPTEMKPPAADAVAATVNGQKVPELAVFRGLMQVQPQFRDKARPEVLNHLIENTIIDQYLGQLKIQVDAKEIEEHVGKIKAEAAKNKQDFVQTIAKLYMTEEDLRRELSYALRWEKFVAQQGTDEKLKAMFEGDKEMFNGARIQAKHILIGKEKVKDAAEAQKQLLKIKQDILTTAGQEYAKASPSLDAVAKEKERTKALDKAFAQAAMKDSTCPSKVQGGDLGFFPRIGVMVEPFSKAAFMLKPYEISDPVATEFGVHLIMAVDRKAGKDVQFQAVKAFVQDVYGEKLREAILAAYRPRSKVEISATK